MLFNNAVADAQAQARSFSNALGGIERLENTLWLLDSPAGILNLDVNAAFQRVASHLQDTCVSGFKHGVHRVVNDV
jgi:hypothetical protein